MSWLYIIAIILILYYTGLYAKLPDPAPTYFSILDSILPPLFGLSVNDEIEGIYESDFKQHGFKKYFMITRDISDDTKLVAIKYRGSKSSTDDPKKLRDKEIMDMRSNALKADYAYKKPVTKTDTGYNVYGVNAARKGTTLIFNKDGKTVKYYKIEDL